MSKTKQEAAQEYDCRDGVREQKIQDALDRNKEYERECIYEAGKRAGAVHANQHPSREMVERVMQLMRESIHCCGYNFMCGDERMTLDQIIAELEKEKS